MTATAILLDTHAWLWLVSGEKIAGKALTLVEEAMENHLGYLSDISLWEVSMLAKKNRITLGQPVLPWINHALKVTGLHLIRLTPEIVVESTELPGDFHGDPADRLLVATARVQDLTLVTRDERILEYGASKRVHTLQI